MQGLQVRSVVSRYGRWSPRSIQLATNVPVGKIEVMEVFSYGCIACNGFQPVMERLTRSLPPNAQIVLVPASFNPGEAWPIFQRAYFAAWTLGIADRTHQAMFDAIWKNRRARRQRPCDPPP